MGYTTKRNGISGLINWKADLQNCRVKQVRTAGLRGQTNFVRSLITISMFVLLIPFALDAQSRGGGATTKKGPTPGPVPSPGQNFNASKKKSTPKDMPQDSGPKDLRNLFDRIESPNLFDFGPVKPLFPELEDQGFFDRSSDRSKSQQYTPSTSKRSSTSDRLPTTTRQGPAPTPSEKTYKSLDYEGAETGDYNFNQTQLLEFLKIISDGTGLKFVVSPQVISSKITIHTSEPISNNILPGLLQSILEVNGLAAIKAGDYLKIVPGSEAINYNMETSFGSDADSIPNDDRMITQVIPIKEISVSDIAPVLAPLLSKSGKLITHDATNIIIVCSTASNIHRLLRIIKEVDIPGLSTEEQLFVYYVENGDAKNIATIINSLFIEDETSIFEARKQSLLASRSGKQQEADAIMSTISTSLVVADQTINALIIKTTAATYALIEETIKKLDVPPRQVLIEVLIAEITLDEETEFGIEWELGSSYRADFGGRQHTLDQSAINNLGLGTVGASDTSAISLLPGFNFFLSETNQFVAMLNAKASESKLNVLASPHILASDNQQASISITDEVPVEQRDIAEGGHVSISYSYKDAGIKLTVTPHINERGMITLELDQEVSEISNAPSATTQPTFRKRKAKTTVSIFDKQTLIIGGLIEETSTSGHTGIPILSELPLIGFLFRSKSEISNKTELVILLTPHLIDSQERGDEITGEYKERVKDVFKKLSPRDEIIIEDKDGSDTEKPVSEVITLNGSELDQDNPDAELDGDLIQTEAAGSSPDAGEETQAESDADSIIPGEEGTVAPATVIIEPKNEEEDGEADE